MEEGEEGLVMEEGEEGLVMGLVMEEGRRR
jgi:hypothetical protein